MQHAGVIPVCYSNVAVEILADNAAPEAEAVYGALGMPFSGLVFGLRQYFFAKLIRGWETWIRPQIDCSFHAGVRRLRRESQKRRSHDESDACGVVYEVRGAEARRSAKTSSS
jgi:hypothetical protein